MLTHASRSLGVTLPNSLRDLLLQSNGVKDKYLAKVIWSVDELLSQNRAMRDNPDFSELYMPFDNLLFFGEAGNGDLFCLRVLSHVVKPEVFAWNHETDGREWIAPSLDALLFGWFAGDIVR
jgi:hypothetical protein